MDYAARRARRSIPRLTARWNSRLAERLRQRGHRQAPRQVLTLYAHQSRIAEGITKGSKISQGQLLGYVGATGWATGPHLHYEFRVDNQPIDPLSVDLPVARTLEPAEIRAFKQAVAPYQQQIQLLTEFQQTLPDALTNVASR